MQYWKTNSNIEGVGRSVYQIVLQEGSTDILFNYDAEDGANSAGANATMVGIESDKGAMGLRYPGFDVRGAYTSRSVRFYLDNSSIVYDHDNDGYNSDVDCNDYDASIHPGAREICGDGIDNNCNGQIDENCGVSVVDRDNDGYNSDVDCNDYDSSIHPGAKELCDGKDNNCDGVIDENCNVAVDKDGDGYDQDQDCDDNNAAIHPGAAELCDGIDNNCDGVIDEGCGKPGNGSGGPDAFGYRYISSDDIGGPKYKWEVFTQDKQSLKFNADDGLVSAIPMGFFYNEHSEIQPYFEFYGKKQNSVYVAGNGYLTFTPDSKYTNFAYNGQDFPALDEVNNLIAPLWLGGQSAADASARINLEYETFGNEPQRRFVMQFTYQSAGSERIEYQVVFFEGENTIQINYKEIASLGADYRVAGIENSDGSVGLRYAALDEMDKITERSVLFYRGDPPVVSNTKANLYMPLVMTGNFKTTVVLLNESGTETVVGKLFGHNAKGESVVSSEDIVLNPLASYEGTLDDFFGDFDLSEIAYLSFVADVDMVVGSVHFNVKGQGMTGAYPSLSHAEASETLYLSTVKSGNDSWKSIVSLVNTSDESCAVSVDFDNGASKQMSLDPGQQYYFYPVSEMEVFSSAKKRVPLKETSPVPTNAVIKSNKNGLVGAALFYQGEKLSALALDGSVEKQIIFPYLLDSSDWWGGLIIGNSGIDAVKASLKGYQDGEKSALQFDEHTLSALQSWNFSSNGLFVDTGSGWLQVDAASPVAGAEFFGTFDDKQLASVATGRLQGKSGVFSHIDSAGDQGWSGIVFTNPGAEETLIKLTAYDAVGHKVGEVRKLIPAYGQLVGAVDTFFGSVDLKSASSVRYSAENDIVGIVLNGRNYSVDGYPLGELEALPSLRIATTGERY